MQEQKHDLGIATDLEVIDQFLDVKELFLIDAGCGNMHLSKALAERGAAVLAIDPDPVQAKKNQQTDIIPNVGFAETGADAIPVEDKLIDGVLFPYSLHHIPAELYNDVFTEVLRILKPDGFVYVIEPVAEGSLNDIMRLFHDESRVRAAAQAALDSIAKPKFSNVDVIEYRTSIRYESWDHFANRYAGKSYNTNYTEADVRADHVREKFQQIGEPLGFSFEAPMRVTWLRNPQSAVHA